MKNDQNKPAEIVANDLIQMYYYDRLTLDECAAVYGCAPATIAATLETSRRLAPVLFPAQFKEARRK
ncbi:hypothetical protein IJ103_00055 [Candidatus Saccharibacteria bacterium]|nr:hypothetical protein [Candidatus Saccharibacteria bacterium]